MFQPRNCPFSQANILTALPLGPLHLRLALFTAAQLQSEQNICKAIYTTDRERQTDGHKYTVHSLLEDRAGYSSGVDLEHTCLSADFKLDTLEIPSYKSHLCSEYKCPNVMRRLPHCGFTPAVYSYLLIWCPPPPPKLDAQRRVHQITILNLHTY